MRKIEKKASMIIFSKVMHMCIKGFFYDNFAGRNSNLAAQNSENSFCI